MNFKTVLGWLAAAFVIWWVIMAPGGAAHVVHNIGTFLTTSSHGFSSFWAKL